MDDTSTARENTEVTSANRTVHFAPNRGRLSSWIAVIVMILASIVAGVGVILWNWLLFGIACGVFVLAGIGALIGGIMDDVH